MATYDAGEITFKAMGQLVTLTHVHTPALKPSVSHFFASPLRPLPPHMEQVGENKVCGGTLTHTHTHTICSVSLPTPCAPPLNGLRYVKRLPHLKQQPLPAT